MIESFTIIIGIIALLSVRFDVKNKKLLFFLIILPISLLDGLRWEMGADWVSYYSYFTDDSYSVSFDPGFILYTEIIKGFTDNYSVYLLITSLFIYIGIFYGVFRITDGSFIALFYLIGTIPWYSGSMRQMMACVFFVWAFKAVIDRKPIHYSVLMLLGILFHVTVIVFAPMYLIYGMSTVFYVLLFAMLITVSSFTDKMLFILENVMRMYGFDKNMATYLGGTYELSNPILGFLRKILTLSGLFVFTLISKSSVMVDSVKWDKLKFSLVLSSLSILFYYIGTYKISHVSSRLDIYTGIIVTSILIGFIDKSLAKKSNRILFYLFVLSLVGVFYYRLLWMDLFHPYSSIFYNYDLNRELH